MCLVGSHPRESSFAHCIDRCAKTFASPPVSVATCKCTFATVGTTVPHHRHLHSCRCHGSEACPARSSTSTYLTLCDPSSDAHPSCVSISCSFHRFDPGVFYVGWIRSRDPFPSPPRWGARGRTGQQQAWHGWKGQVVLLQTDIAIEETWKAREGPNNWIGRTSPCIHGKENDCDHASIHRSMRGPSVHACRHKQVVEPSSGMMRKFSSDIKLDVLHA